MIVKDAVLSRFDRLLSFQSVSADSTRFEEIENAAKFLKVILSDFGFKTFAFDRKGHPPCIIGVLKSNNRKASTIGIYGHYDVQPEDPLEEWKSNPFSLTLREGKMYGRGIADNKGHIIQNLAAIEEIIHSDKLKNSLIIIFEGEEESSGDHFEEYAEEARDILSTIDAFFVTDMGMHNKHIPQIYYALRGIVHFELTVSIGTHDLHSGVYGNAVYNAANVLTKLLSQIKDVSSGEIQIPHFYEDVRKITGRELALLKRVIRSEEEEKEKAGVKKVLSFRGVGPSMVPKLFPSFDIHGITSGYSGEGSKTIIPHRATAKFSFRLVEHQDPFKIERLVSDFIAGQIPDGVDYELTVSSHAFPFYTDIENPFVKKTAKIFKEVFGNETLFNRSGATIPAAEILQRIFQKPIILTGFTLPDDNIHAPNENMDEEMFWKGIEALEKVYSTTF